LSDALSIELNTLYLINLNLERRIFKQTNFKGEVMEILSKAIEVSWATQRSDGGRGIPLLFWGSPGIGKSAIISSIAKQMGLHCEVVILSIRDPADVGGLPVRTENGIELFPPSWANNLVKHNGGILFFDELNCAPPAVQAAALRIVCEKVVGEVVLPKDTLIIAACNPAEEGANSGDLEPPLANRFCHFDLKPDVEMFGDYLQFNKQKVVDYSPIDKKLWDENYSYVTSIITNYLKTNRDNIQGNVEDRSFASPRSWEMTCRLWATCRTKRISAFDYIKGCVGEGITKEVYEYMAKLDLPLPTDILYKNAMPNRIDKIYTSIMATLSFVFKYNEHVPKFCEVMSSISINDIKVQVVTELLNKNLGNSKEFLNLVEGLEL